MKPLERIDMHSHYFPKSYYALLKKYGVEHPDNVFIPEWDVDSHRAKMEQANFLYTLISITSPFFNFVDPEHLASACREVNEDGAEIVARNSDKFGLLAALPLPDIQASVEEIHYAHTHLGIKGFALPTNACGVYMGNPDLDPVMQALDDLGAVVTLHPTSPSMVIPNINEEVPIPLYEFYVDTGRALLNMCYRDIFKRYPNIRFIMPHAGGTFSTMVGRLSSGYGKLLDIKGNMQRMYFDLCGSPMPTQLDALLPIVGAERLVYGIDFPYAGVNDALESSFRLDEYPTLTPEMRQMIYIDNAIKLIGNI